MDLKKMLKEYLIARGPSEFQIARISKARLGICDRDRANWLGFTLTLTLIEPSGGESVVSLTTAQSEEVLNQVGHEDVKGRYCWVYIKDNCIHFVRLVSE